MSSCGKIPVLKEYLKVLSSFRLSCPERNRLGKSRRQTSLEILPGHRGVWVRRSVGKCPETGTR